MSYSLNKSNHRPCWPTGSGVVKRYFKAAWSVRTIIGRPRRCCLYIFRPNTTPRSSRRVMQYRDSVGFRVRLAYPTTCSLPFCSCCKTAPRAESDASVSVDLDVYYEPKLSQSNLYSASRFEKNKIRMRVIATSHAAARSSTVIISPRRRTRNSYAMKCL